MCPFYRHHEDLSRGKGLGDCDVDGGQATCEGDIQFCGNPESLKRQLANKTKTDDAVDNGQHESKGKYSNYKVLMVDDQEQVRNFITNILVKQGHQCTTANNGKEALNEMCRSKFDALITDIVMPEVDGIALTKQILSMYPGLPVMVITGHAEEYSAESAIDAGAREFIEKPFSVKEFVVRFNKMMRDHEVLRQIDAKEIEMFLQPR